MKYNSDLNFHEDLLNWCITARRFFQKEDIICKIYKLPRCYKLKIQWGKRLLTQNWWDNSYDTEEEAKACANAFILGFTM